MIVKNFANIIIAKLTQTSGDIIRADGTTATFGYTIFPFISFADSYYGIAKGGNYACWPIFGNGENPPTVDDITMENAMTSGYVYTRFLRVIDYNEGTMSLTTTFANTSSEDITITEIGILLGNGNNIAPTLLYKEKLPSPIVVAPSGKHTFSINFSYQ